nr:YdbL family protein [Sphingomonas arenae]
MVGCWNVEASAQSNPVVNSARSAGLIGERFDGYLGVRTAIPPVTRRATEDVNIRRRALYAGLAGRRGVSPQEVGITAGCSLLARVAVGEWYLLSDGVWRRRRAGQAAPVPDYCTGG